MGLHFSDIMLWHRIEYINWKFGEGRHYDAIALCEQTARQLRTHSTNFTPEIANRFAEDLEFLILMLMIGMPHDDIAEIRSKIRLYIRSRSLIIRRIYNGELATDIGLFDQLPRHLQVHIADLAQS